MTESNRAELNKFNQASQKRELWEKRELKLKRVRVSFAILFTSSAGIVLIAFLINAVINLNRIMAGIGYTALILTALSMVGLVIVYFKSFSVRLEGDRARKAEGILAENVYRSLLRDPHL